MRTGGSDVHLADFEVLSFDCYGTLIDWESGLVSALQPLLHESGANWSNEQLLETFAEHESTFQKRHPDWLYPRILAEVHRVMSKALRLHLNETDHRRFGESVLDWPAFADSAAALRKLKEHAKLVILSNVDQESFAASQRRLGVIFDGVLTAQEIGSYKPDPRNFQFLISHVKQELGLDSKQLLHVAQSLYHDHEPAKKLGLTTAWIDRRHENPGWGATKPPATKPSYDFRFKSMSEFADAFCEARQPSS